ncbi:MAG: ABC transporter substrate-binding protein [Ottowia sp.]|nr:ABC transporter substrate-binding protein [Ottowia sp.]
MSLVSRLFFAALLALAAAVAPAREAAPAIRVVGDDGHAVQLAAAPQRVVSLLPSLTESVCALDACARLVGVDRYSTWPPSLAQLPRLGGGHDPDIEATLRLRPDVVLMPMGNERGAARLRELGVPVLALNMRTLDEVRRVLQTLATLLALPEGTAEREWQRINAAVDAAAASLPQRARGVRVFFEAAPGPWAAGEASFIGELLTRLGARNIVTTEMGPFPRLSPEFVLRAQPDVIIVPNRGMGSIPSRTYAYPGWPQAMRALKEGRVCMFDGEESDTISRPSPRIAEAARLLARCLAEKAP